MCGIIGCINIDDAGLLVEKQLSLLLHRGPDGSSIYTINEKTVFGHSLLGIVDRVPQPLIGDGVLVANCEIYNWKDLAKKYGYDVRNDSELLLKLLDEDKLSYDELDGVFAFAYLKGNKLIFGRDLFGVKPLFYSFRGDGIMFASEAKVIDDAKEVLPGRIISIDVLDKGISEDDYLSTFFESIVASDINIIELERLLIHSIKKRVPSGQKVGVLFSGGIDSTFISYVLKKNNIEFSCYSSGFYEEGLKYPEDLEWSKRVAEELDFDFTLVRVDGDLINHVLPKLTDAIESNNVVKVGVALPFYFALEQAKNDGVRVMFSGLGSEEIFAGYQRHEQSDNINEECIKGLKKMHERDLYRDDLISMFFGIEMRLPFLDRSLVGYALGLSDSIKIKDGVKKYILRKIAEDMGMPNDIAFRPKRAAQYGSRFDSALEKLSKKHGFTKKADYLKSINSREMFNN